MEGASVAWCSSSSSWLSRRLQAVPFVRFLTGSREPALEGSWPWLLYMVRTVHIMGPLSLVWARVLLCWEWMWGGSCLSESQLRFVDPANGRKECLLVKESIDLALPSLLASAGLEQLSGVWQVRGGRMQCCVFPTIATGVLQQRDGHFVVVGNDGPGLLFLFNPSQSCC